MAELEQQRSLPMEFSMVTDQVFSKLRLKEPVAPCSMGTAVSHHSPQFPLPLMLRDNSRLLMEELMQTYLQCKEELSILVLQPWRSLQPAHQVKHSSQEEREPQPG